MCLFVILLLSCLFWAGIWTKSLVLTRFDADGTHEPRHITTADQNQSHPWFSTVESSEPPGLLLTCGRSVLQVTASTSSARGVPATAPPTQRPGPEPWNELCSTLSVRPPSGCPNHVLTRPRRSKVRAEHLDHWVPEGSSSEPPVLRTEPRRF